MEGKGAEEGGSDSVVESSQGGCSGSSSSNEGTSTTTTTTTDNPPSSSQAKDKDTTKPPLQVMAKTVAHYWKRVSSTDLRRYQELARQEQKRYRSEMKEYKAMLRDRQEQLDRQREEQLSLAAANNAAASAAAGGLGLGLLLAGSAAFSSSSSSWTPEQMVSIFSYLNQAQMEQPPPNSTNGSQEQELIFNAQNAMIVQLQNQIRSLQQTLPNGPTTTTTTTTSQEAHVSVPSSSSTTTKGKSKSPASSRGLLGRLEAQASLMRLQIERGKARSLGAADNSVGEQRVEPTGTGADEGTNLALSFPNATSTQAYSSNFGGDTQDPSPGSASGAAISLLASTVPTDNDNHKNNNSNNGGVFTQPPTTGTQASLPMPNLNLDHFQQYPPFVAPSSNPTPPQGWSSANPLSGMPSVPMGNFPQDCPMPPQLTAGLPFQQQFPSTVSSISGISNGIAQQAQYQSQGSSISALSDHLSNAESADERSSSEETLDAFSIAQILFGPGGGKNSDTK